ncbi:hypothetical protein G6L37_06650 [Agrobacterium rubi]|nr:hypothetical protein [Agrobacterium rubi]NTF25043.1 hypothetical protein [Agrobacterium rubi]
MKKTWREGDRSRAVCDGCAKIVESVMERRDLPVRDKKGYVQSVLVGVCCECDGVVTIAPQEWEPVRRRDPVIAICGSMAFIDHMEEIATYLKDNGYVTLTPQREEDGRDWSELSREEAIALKRGYVDLHLHKIRDCDAVLIVNIEKRGTPGYVGPNTLMEAAFAHALDVPVVFLNDPFDQAAGLECASVSHACLDGDISTIKERLRVL